jgi:hypothetical protein
MGVVPTQGLIFGWGITGWLLRASASASALPGSKSYRAADCCNEEDNQKQDLKSPDTLQGLARLGEKSLHSRPKVQKGSEKPNKHLHQHSMKG